MQAYDVVVVGGGPGGYVAAIRAAQLGLKVALVERDSLGGVCLNWGCIPTKSLIYNAFLVNTLKQAGEFGIYFDGLRVEYAAAFERSRRVVNRLVKGVQALMKKHAIPVYEGSALLAGPRAVKVRPDGPELEARHVILATGGRPRPLPGVEFDGTRVLSSRDALSLREVPRSLLVVGGGAIGLEFSYVFASYGCAVTVVEMMPQVLPLDEPDIAQVVERQLAKQGIRIRTGSRVLAVQPAETGVQVRIDTPNGEEGVEVERVLVAIGVQGNVEDLGLEEAGVETNRGFIRVNERMETSVPGVYAIGDVTGIRPLAHVASKQGEIAVEAIAGRDPRPLSYSDMPRAVYCHPQVASVGLTERDAIAAGHDVKTGSFPFRANGKALGQHDWEGFCKIVMDTRTGELLGGHLVGPEVTELLPGLGITRALEGTVEDIADAVFAHPTLSEVLHEAALVSLGRPIHI